jgi:hypothetical protein
MGDGNPGRYSVTQRSNDPPWSAAPPDAGRSLEERMAMQIERGQPDGAEFLDSLSDDDLAEFSMALSIDAELKAEDEAAAAAAEPGVLPLRRPARPARVLDRRVALLAAVLAGVTLLPLAWRASQPGAVRYPSEAVAMLEQPAAGLPADFDTRAWSPTRSRGEVVTEEGRPVRLGVYGVDLEVAIRAGDAANTQILAMQIAALLTDAHAGGTAAARYFNPIVARPNAPAAELLPILKEANRAAANAIDPDRYALGAWAEAALLAIARRDAGFFREARTRRTLDRAEDLVDDDAEARTAIHAIRASLESESLQWPELEKAMKTLLGSIGR